MSLITASNMKTLTDHIAAAWEAMAGLGSDTGSVVPGTTKGFLNTALTMIVTDVDDFDQQQDLAPALSTSLTKAAKEAVAKANLNGLIGALDSHCKNRGTSVSPTITSLLSFLNYYNGGSGGARFANMAVASLQDFYHAIKGSYLGFHGVMSPAINPANGAANGMGVRAVGGAFTDGAAVDVTKYSEVNLVAVLTADFVGGSAAPTLTVPTLDHTGAVMNFTGTFGSNNPTSAVATTTSEIIVAYTRQVVTLVSAAGIVAGSWVTIDAGTNLEETVLVEAVATNDITAVFKKGHASGATVTGKLTLPLTPATGGRRCANVTGITINITAHSAGTVRIEGVQDRAAV